MNASSHSAPSEYTKPEDAPPSGPWKTELRVGLLWRVVNGTTVWGSNKHDAKEEEANAVRDALNRLHAKNQIFPPR